MKLPKIIFRRSWLYDNALVREPNWKKPEEEFMKKHFQKIQDDWRPFETKILKAISSTTKLSWNEKEIVVYFTYGVIPYSDPLTINPVSNIHTITHELIHRIISEPPENSKRINDNWNLLMDKYKSETQKCRTHIVIHAIHLAILKKHFDDKTIQKEMAQVKHPDYVRSWEIVKRDGYKAIISKLTKGL